MLQFKLRRGTAADWAIHNPILKLGEPGFETDTGKFKIGNDYTKWLDLPYFVDEDTIQELLDGVSGGNAQALVDAHINSETPHPVYDEGPSLFLLYQNAKV
jgi:hypothetical protein